MAPQVVIVGAGISGLATAYRLHQARPALPITVLEADARPGGKVWTEAHDGFRLEWGPNGFLDSKPHVLQLGRDLGLESELVEASASSARNRFIDLNGHLDRLPGSLGDMLRTPLLSWRGKLALFAEPLRPRRTNKADESVAAFARRRLGREAADVFLDALVTGIYAGDAELLSAAASFPRMTALERDYGSLVRGLIFGGRKKRPRLWSFHDGLRRLIESLVSQLPQPPICGVKVVELRGGPPYTVRAADGRSWPADAVVLACPTFAATDLLAGLDAELARELAGIAYNRVVVVALGYRSADVPTPADGFGFIAPQRTRRDLLGVQWCSATFPDRAPTGMVLWRALCGGWHRPEQVDWDDERLLAAVRQELMLVQGVTAEPVFARVVRWDRAIPQYFIGHRARVERIERQVGQHPGLFLTGNASHGVALNDCVEQAEKTAARVVMALGAAGAGG